MKMVRWILMGSLLAGIVAVAPASAQALQKPLRGAMELRVAGGRAAPGEPADDLARYELRPYPGHFFGQLNLDVYLSPGFSVTPSLIGFVQGEDDSESICPFAPPCGRREQESALTVLIPEIQLRHHRRQAHSDLFLGGGVGYGVGLLSRDERWFSGDPTQRRDTLTRERYRTAALSLSVFAGLAHDLGGPLGVFIEGGYRHYRPGGFRAADAATHEERRLRLDLSGPFASVGFSIRVSN